MTSAPVLDLPQHMRRLPLDKHGRPVPWFVHWDGPEPDFRIVGAGKLVDAMRFELCWVCGTRRGRHAAFILGPMCAINRNAPEPPSHLECAIYSARACPFLATPRMRRRTTGLPSLAEQTAGIALDRNPGVALVWSSKTWKPYQVEQHDDAGQPTAGMLWNVGEPTQTSWWCEGRPATRAEVEASIDSGLPALREMCDTERHPDRAHAELSARVEAAISLLPE